MSAVAETFSDPSYARRRATAPARLGSAVVLVGLVTGAGALYVRMTGEPDRFPISSTALTPAATPIAIATATPAVPVYEPLLDSAFSLGLPPASAFADRPPLQPLFVGRMPPEIDTAAVEPIPEPPVASPLVAQLSDAPADNVPLPPPRPAFPRLRTPEPAVRTATAEAAPAPAAPGTPSFFQRLFGDVGRGPQTGALAYASPEAGSMPGFGRVAAPLPTAAVGGGTAIYDISSRTVTLPSGRRLEAHSGLGELMDDPNHVDVRNRGATPPHLYDLTLRESLFHGVQALRLTPVGPGTVYGRDGILAHRFMLGPTGASNGCVSFRDYDAFLAAYRAGEVRRILVVARGS